MKDYVFSDPAGWVHVFPFGEFPNGSFIQVLDEAAANAMVRAFGDELEDENFPGVLVDFDHFSMDTSKPSVAAGWITRLEKRGDGLYAQVRWSDSGLAAVESGQYRLVSPVWDTEDCQDLGGGRIRPLMLDRIALTNSPCIKGATPITNRQGGEMMSSELSVSLATRMTRDEANREIHRLVNRKQQEKSGYTYDFAYSVVRRERPDLFAVLNRNGGDQVMAQVANQQAPVAPVVSQRGEGDRVDRYTARVRRVVANRMVRDLRIPFDQAWNAALGSELLVNRAPAYLQQQDEQVLESFFNKLKAKKDLPGGCTQAIDDMRRNGFPFQQLDDAMARNFGLNPEEVYREKALKLMVGRIQGKLDQGQSFKEAFDGLNAKEFQNLAEVFNASPAPYLTRYV